MVPDRSVSWSLRARALKIVSKFWYSCRAARTKITGRMDSKSWQEPGYHISKQQPVRGSSARYGRAHLIMWAHVAKEKFKFPMPRACCSSLASTCPLRSLSTV